MDESTAQAIERLDGSALSPNHACGCRPIAGLLKAIATHGMSAERIALITSADTAGDRNRVVGYGAWAFS